MATRSLPLFVSKDDSGSFVLDDKIIIIDHMDGDELLLKNAISGRIFTSQVFPLIWNVDAPDQLPTFVRSIEYLQNATLEKVKQLSWEDRMLVGCSLRDLVWAHHHHPQYLTESLCMDLESIETVIKNASNAMPTYEGIIYHGVSKSPWPTRSQKVALD